MSQIEFDEQQRQSYSNFDNPPKMVSWVIEHSGGLIKDQKQAQYFLFGFVVVILIISFVLSVKSFSGSKEPPKGLEGEVVEIYDDF
ncbi:hypothetical protein KKC45_00200 [Patescibacteria group bacterium]|nr:hypothetical protein [Patescibacteria group bacterium]